MAGKRDTGSVLPLSGVPGWLTDDTGRCFIYPRRWGHADIRLVRPWRTQFQVHLESVGLNRAVRESLLAMVRTTAVQEISGSLTGSQRPQSVGHVWPHPAAANTAKQHVRPCRATLGAASGMPPKQSFVWPFRCDISGRGRSGVPEKCSPNGCIPAGRRRPTASRSWSGATDYGSSAHCRAGWTTPSDVRARRYAGVP